MSEPGAWINPPATGALAKIGEQAIEAIISLLDSEEPTVRCRAAHMLGSFRHSRIAVQTLIKTLYDPDSNVRRYAVEALGEIRDIDAVEPLIALLNDFESIVRYETIQALGRIRDNHATKHIGVILCNDPDKYVRQKAAQALSLFHDVRAIEHLIIALKDSDIEVRWFVIDTLTEIGDESALLELDRVSHEDHEHTQWGHSISAAAWHAAKLIRQKNKS